MSLTVKERPILMSAPMVNAIQADRKTMTRRIFKGEWFYDGETGVGAGWEPSACPYGVIGQRLWLREAFRYVDFECLPGLNEQGVRWNAAVEYRDGVRGPRTDNVDPSTRLGWRPSIYMPRWASRILLEITDIRVERLWDISEADAIAEGARSWLDSLDGRTYDNAEKEACRFTKIIDSRAGIMSARGVFAALWEQINGKGSWARNDWVWAITFRRIDA